MIGAGTMGGGIAMCFANAGIPVTVIEAEQAALDRGLGRVGELYAGVGQARQHHRRAGARSGAGGSRARSITRRSRDADIVVEAVFEEMGVKKEVFGKLDRVAKPGAVLATNTSYLDIDEIAARDAAGPATCWACISSARRT